MIKDVILCNCFKQNKAIEVEEIAKLRRLFKRLFKIADTPH